MLIAIFSRCRTAVNAILVKLAALILVENLQRPEAGQRFLQSFDLEIGPQRDRHSPAEHSPAEPVDNGDQVDEAARHRDVRDVGRPHLVGPRQRQLALQLGIDSCPGAGFEVFGHR
jgi:hypothetical protein